MEWVFGGLAVLVIVIIVSCIRVVPQAKAFVIERVGAYRSTWGVGVHLLIPFFDRVRSRVSLMEKVADFPPQPAITKDNITLAVDAVVFYQITDPRLYCYGVENPMRAINNLTITTMRNVIGSLELDDILTSRDHINATMCAVLDKATDPWGIKVTRVEVKSIEPPHDVKDAMEKQMKAERERRETLLQAEGQKNASILIAEGEKQAKILTAEADKASAILHAEADKAATIKRAEGEAEALLKVQQAKADSIRLINEANPSRQVLALESLKTIEKMADGKATKIIIPSEMQSLAGTLAALTEAAGKDNT